MQMAFTKSDRVLMRVTEDMAREVRALAELEHRTIQDQYRFLISTALQQGKLAGKGRVEFGSQAPSTATFAEEQAKQLPSGPVKPGQLLLPGTAGPIPARKRRIA
jgi:hypothetical protein